MLAVAALSFPAWKGIVADVAADPRCPCPVNETAYKHLPYVKHIRIMGDAEPCPPDDNSLEFEKYLSEWPPELRGAQKEVESPLPSRRFVAGGFQARYKCLHTGHMSYLRENPYVFVSSYLQESDFRNSFLRGLNFEGAGFGRAKLQGALFLRCDLSRATLGGADLTDAMLTLTNVQGAQFSRATLRNVRYEVEGVPNLNTMYDAAGLDTLCYLGSPKSLVELRDAFSKAGMTEQARRVNYSWRTWVRIRAGGVMSYLEWIFVSLTCRYGQAPFRPLSLIALSVALFFFGYWYALVRSQTPMVFSAAVSPETGKPAESAEPVSRMGAAPAIPYALFLSLLFAFRIGWREFNIGSWIEHLRPIASETRTRGWVRTMAGVQSLLSVYLLALCLLSLINGYI